jgi:hypothetical protein
MAAQQGWDAAQYNLGWMYENGRGVPQSHADAVKWYCLVAKRGNGRAKHKISIMTEKGSGLADRCLWEVEDTAVKYWERSEIVIFLGLLVLVLVCGGSIGAVYLGFSKLKVILIALAIMFLVAVLIVGVVIWEWRVWFLP